MVPLGYWIRTKGSESPVESFATSPRLRKKVNRRNSLASPTADSCRFDMKNVMVFETSCIRSNYGSYPRPIRIIATSLSYTISFTKRHQYVSICAFGSFAAAEEYAGQVRSDDRSCLMYVYCPTSPFTFSCSSTSVSQLWIWHVTGLLGFVASCRLTSVISISKYLSKYSRSFG